MLTVRGQGQFRHNTRKTICSVWAHFSLYVHFNIICIKNIYIKLCKVFSQKERDISKMTCHGRWTKQGNKEETLFEKFIDL